MKKKPSKKRCQKRDQKRASALVHPGGRAAPVRGHSKTPRTQTDQLQTDTFREAHSEDTFREAHSEDQLPTFNTPGSLRPGADIFEQRLPRGSRLQPSAFGPSIYFLAPFHRILGGRPADNESQSPFSTFRCSFSGFQRPFSRFQSRFSGFPS